MAKCLKMSQPGVAYAIGRGERIVKDNNFSLCPHFIEKVCKKADHCKSFRAMKISYESLHIKRHSIGFFNKLGTQCNFWMIE